MVSSRFTNRVKRLIEFDRSPEKLALMPASELPHAEFAFNDHCAEGQGNEARYTHFNVFCLAIALDLIDAGFKQLEVLYLMKHVRNDLEGEHGHIMKNPPDPRQPIAAENRPNCPSFEQKEIHLGDCRVYMVLDRVEITEVFGKSPSDPAILFQPVFCRGTEALHMHFHNRSSELRKAIVLEIANLAVQLSELLKEVPPVKRGRK